MSATAISVRIDADAIGDAGPENWPRLADSRDCRGLEREVVLDRDHRYEINGEESRTLAATGAFRVVSERDSAPHPSAVSEGGGALPVRRQGRIRDAAGALNGGGARVVLS